MSDRSRHSVDAVPPTGIAPEADALLVPSRSTDAAPDEALRAIADELLLHGILTMLAEREPLAMEQRIATAMDTIGRLEPRLPSRAPSLPFEGTTPRHRRWNVRMLAGSSAFAAMLLLALTATLFVRTAPTATAALTQIVDAGRSIAFRRYQFVMEREGTPPAMPPRRGLVDVGPAGRFVCRFEGPAGNTVVTMGFDGEEYWLVPPVGPVRVGVAPGPIARVAELGGELDQLMLGPLVDNLRRHYQIRFADDGAIEHGAGPIRLEAIRRPNRPSRRPERVRLVARRSDFAIVEFEAQWDADRGPQRMSGLRLRLVDAPDPGLAWFSRGSHHSPDRVVVEVKEGEERRPLRFDGIRDGNRDGNRDGLRGRPDRPDRAPRERPGRPGRPLPAGPPV
ncbi:MAG: hypothetical protein KDA22_01590 [Phycisphaerales bacterium]|nr:hypothetical protein [Phycisphaerales bacterium]